MQQSRVGCLCTCARAHRASVSKERLGRLGSLLVCELGSWTRCLTQVMGGASLHVRTCTPCVSSERFDRLCSNLVCGLGVTKYLLSTSQGWGGASLHTCARATPPPPPSPYRRIRLNNIANIWCVVRDPIVTRFTKVGGGVTAHSHVRLQFRCLGNRSALTLKPHQKQTYLFRSRSFIAKHGVLLVHYL